MAESILSMEEGPASPDVFSDIDIAECFMAVPALDESYPGSSGPSEPEPSDDSPEWRGTSMDEILRKGSVSFGNHQHPPLIPSESHTILIRLPIENRGPPRSYPTQSIDKWTIGYVRMPNSPHSMYPIEPSRDKSRELRMRWEVIQESLLQSFISSAQLEAAILSYNKNYAERWDFSALHHFFTEIIEEDEAQMFFNNLLPKMIQLALQLPTLVTGPIPLLRKYKNASISLSQLQVASLLANAFFCTFPRRNSTNPNSEYAMYPYINFNRLFACYKEERPNRSAAVAEKLKCLFHYFRRVTTTAPEGTITIQRRYIPKGDCPKWDKLHNLLPPLHITSKGTIETQGAGLLQVDFANKYVGGGVLNWGCVQEEIRFVICPELMVTMLVTEALNDTEALIISGAERYSKYEGYSNTFKWMGDFIDETPRDTSGRRKTSIVAIDALYFTQADTQFDMGNIVRELNKAYVGFSSSDMNKHELSAVATGNWGCGAFRGNPKLKVLIQLMAAAVAGRSLVYFTFGDTALRDSVAEMYWHLLDRNIDISRLFCLLRQYNTESTNDHSDFYHFLFNRSKMKPITNYFKVSENKTSDNATKCPQEKIDKKISRNIRRNKLPDEEKEERIRSMLDDGKNDSLEETSLEKITVVPQATSKEQSCCEIKNSEIESEKVDNRPSPLELFVSNQTIPELSRISDFPILNSKEKSHFQEPIRKVLKTPDKQLKINNGQRKISDFFLLKSS